MAKSRNVDMLNGPILKNLIIFALPVMGLNVLQIIFHATDVAILGIFSSDTSVAAVGATTSLINLFVNFFAGFAIGANVLIARAIGENTPEKSRRYVGTSLFCSIFLGLAVSIVILFGATQFLKWMNCPKSILDMASVYVKVYCMGMPLILLYSFSAVIMRSKGDTLRPLYFLLIGGAINVALNIFFITVLNMHVVGVAIATVASKATTAILSIIVLIKTDGPTKLEKRHFRFYKQEVKEIVYMGLPTAIQSSLFSMSNVLFSSTFNKFGDLAISGNTIGQQFDSLISNALTGFTSGVLTFSSQNLGAKKYNRVWKVLSYSLILSTTIGLALGILIYLLSHQLCGIMTSSEEVIGYATRRLRIMATCHFLSSIMNVFSNLLKAIKKPILSMVGSIFFTLILRLVWLYTIFPLNPTLETYYIVYPITWLLCSIVFAIISIPLLRKIQKKDEELQLAE